MKWLFLAVVAAVGAHAGLTGLPAAASGPAAGRMTFAPSSHVIKAPLSRESEGARVHLAQRRKREEPVRDAGPRTIAQSPCARAYHASMTEILKEFEPGLNTALEHARKAEPSLSGTWMFHGAPQKQRTVRVCAEPGPSGAARCLRWETRPVAAASGPMTPAPPTASETKLIRAVEEFVRMRGVVSDLTKSGRFDSITVRVSDDLTAYLSQPMHPAMCSGGSEIVDFMIANTRTYRARIQEVADTDKAARSLARTRVAQLAAAVKKSTEPSAPTASPTGDTAVPAPVGPQTAASGLPGSIPPPATTAAAPPPASPAPRLDTSSVPEDYLGMIVEIGKLITRDGEAGPVGDGALFDQLARMQTWLRSDAANALDGETRGPLLLALRAVETGIYAELMQSRYGAVNEALFGSIAKLREVHKEQCTCGG